MRMIDCRSDVFSSDLAGFKQGLFPAAFPRLVGQGLVGRLERLELTTPVQVALELRDIALLAVVAAGFVEHLDEYRQQRIDLGLADDVGLLVNVEQNAFGWNGDGLLQLGAQQFIVLRDLGQKQRSEEHTSELQSLMRISSAVFCLKKKKPLYK